MSDIISNKFIEQFVLEKTGIILSGKPMKEAVLAIEQAIRKGDLMATTKKKTKKTSKKK